MIIGHRALTRRLYQFASPAYTACFGQLPNNDRQSLTTRTLQIIEGFNRQQWFDNPVVTVIQGKMQRTDAERIADTVNAFGEVNGKIIYADDTVVNRVIQHMHDFKPEKIDWRQEMREVEKELLSSDIAAQLVANQAIDFGKQDGITEIEEAIEANTVERRLNDMLFEDEKNGKILIRRDPALIGCVSNFSNFLDLFRKVVRNIELGIPVVVLSRSNTTQHIYRWVEILSSLMQKHNVNQGFLTFISCDIPSQRKIISSGNYPMYLTGSRQVAEAIKGICPKLMASTGGPNTMVVEEFNSQIDQAVQLSASIENSGQCTALRHLVVPETSQQKVEEIFEGMKIMNSSRDALQAGEFGAVLESSPPITLEEGYTKHDTLPVAYKISENFPNTIDEHWREVYLDVTKVGSRLYVDDLAKWLNKNQPISLAINCKSNEQSYVIGRELFEKTSMVVYTIGSTDKPALTCQARPQEAEVFGEFPPRKDLSKFTKFPVVVPSSTPGYNSGYTESYLAKLANSEVPQKFSFCTGLLSQASTNVRGYCIDILNYLSSSCTENPKRGFGLRSTLWGLQRPPFDGSRTVIRADGIDDGVILHVIPFYATNARDHLLISSASADISVPGIETVVESEEDFKVRSQDVGTWNVIDRPKVDNDFPLAAHFISRLFALGHIKSTAENNEAFFREFSSSKKWLQLRSD